MTRLATPDATVGELAEPYDISGKLFHSITGASYRLPAARIRRPPPGQVFCGLVQPADAVRHSDGFRMREPRPLDAELLIAAAEEAIGLGLLRLRLDDRPVDLDELITPADHDELIAVLERSVVASAS